MEKKSLKDYLRTTFVQEDPQLNDVMQSIAVQGMPQISVPLETGQLLTMLVKMSKAKHILEIGALGGYSGICLLRGAGGEGELTSLELQKEYAELAEHNIRKAGFNNPLTYKIGDAKESLQQLIEAQSYFDFIFIDADKESYPYYLQASLKLAKSGTVIAADNTLRKEQVLDESFTDDQTNATREFNQAIGNFPGIMSLLLPIGDGLTIGVVK